MQMFTLETSVLLPRPLDEVFAFFTDIDNLPRVMPPWLKFEITTPTPIELAEGVTFEYRLRWARIPMKGSSRITVWEPPHRFVDEQERGPYRAWSHEHAFFDQDGQTRVRDTINYAVCGGGFTNKYIVNKSLRKVFQYRQARVAALLGADAGMGA